MIEESDVTQEFSQPLPGALAAKIAMAMRHTRRVPMDGHNTHDNYRYTRNATILEHCGQGMVEADLALIPIIVRHKIEKEDKKHVCQVEMDFHLIGDTGEAFVARWVGYGENYRTPAMALKTAITNCHVSFVSKLFMIGAVDDPGAEPAGEDKGRRNASRSNYPSAGHRTGTAPQEYPKTWNSPLDAQAWLRGLGATAQEAQAAWLDAMKRCKGYDERKKGEVFAAFFAANQLEEPPADEQEQLAGDEIPA